MNKIKITTDGSVSGTVITNAETGEVIECISELTLRITPGGIDAILLINSPRVELNLTCEALAVDSKTFLKCQEL